MTRTIRSIATAAADALYSRATTRRLDADDIEHAIRVHLRHARREARNEGRRVETTLRGGHVANSYRDRALCDIATISGTSVATLAVHCERGNARHTPYGGGATLVVRARREGQSNGSILASE